MSGTPISSDLIQGGALAILLVFVIAFTLYFRERDKRSEALIQSVVERALNAMDAGVKSQLSVAEALSKLCVTLDAHDNASIKAHQEIMSACQGLSRQGIGAQKRAAS